MRGYIRSQDRPSKYVYVKVLGAAGHQGKDEGVSKYLIEYENGEVYEVGSYELFIVPEEK